MLDAENIKIRTNAQIIGLNEEKEQENEEEKTIEVESFNYNKENDVQIKDSTTNIDLKINNAKWTNKQSNEVTFDILLDSSSIKTNMFKNPTFKIALPSQVEKVILGSSSIIYANGLNLQEPYVEQGEDGRFYIIANLTGAQSQYDENNLALVADLKIPATIILKKDIENVTDKLTVEYTNEYGLSGDIENGTKEKEITIENYQTIENSENNQNEENSSNIKEEQPEQVTEEENKEIRKKISTKTVATQEEIDGLKVEITPLKGDANLQNDDTIYEGEFVKYNIKITNTLDKDINNIRVVANIPEGLIYGELEAEYNKYRGKYLYNFDEDLREKEISIGTIKAGESVTKFYEVKANDLTDDVEKQVNTIIKTYIGETESNNYSINNTIKPATIKAFLGARADAEIDKWFYFINLEMAEGETAKIELKMPEEFEFERLVVNSIAERDNVEVNGDTITIKATENGEYDIQGYIKLKEEKPSIIEHQKELNAYATITSDKTGTVYRTNENRIIVGELYLDAKMYSAKEGEDLRYGEEIEYEVELSNMGMTNSDDKTVTTLIAKVTDYLPKELEGISVTYSAYEILDYSTMELSEEKVEKTVDITGTATDENGEKLPNVNLNIPIPHLDTVKLIIKAKAGFVYEKTRVENSVTAEAERVNTVETNVIVNTILPYDYEEPEEPGEPVDPEEPTDPENPDNPENPNNPNSKVTVSGTAWLDSNEDGQRQDTEELLSGITVMLVNMQDSGRVLQKTTTNNSGRYNFTNLDKGNYIVIFQYDINQYTITTYQNSDVLDTLNSDAMEQTITLNGEKIDVGVTDILQLNTSQSNIDIGLVHSKKLDLKLDKYISQISVKTNSGTKQYDYNNSKLAKVEIKAKEIEGAVVTIKYKVVVTNEGEVPATATEIADYLPEGLKLAENSNLNWNIEGETIVNRSLNNQEIEPGESKELTISLAKTMSSNSTGTFTNIAEIKSVRNSKGLRDIDSISNNKADGEDDLSKADVIISISTGAIVYISISIILLAILIIGVVILIKKKKITKGKISKLSLILLVFVSIMTMQTNIFAATSATSAPKTMWFKNIRGHGIDEDRGIIPHETISYTLRGMDGDTVTDLVCKTVVNGRQCGNHLYESWIFGDEDGNRIGDCNDSGLDGMFYGDYNFKEYSTAASSEEVIEGDFQVSLKKLNDVINEKYLNGNYILGPFKVEASHGNGYVVDIYDCYGGIVPGAKTCDENGNNIDIWGSVTFYIKVPEANMGKGVSRVKLTMKHTQEVKTIKKTYAKALYQVGTDGTFTWVGDGKTYKEQDVLTRKLYLSKQEETKENKTKEASIEWTTFNSGLEIIKQDADNSNVTLPNVTVRVTNAQFGYDKTFTTDADGRIRIDNLKTSYQDGKMYPYTIEETINNNYGYTVKNKDEVLVEQYTVIRKYSLINQKETGNLKLQKQDADSGQPLAQVGFKLRDSAGRYIIAVDQNGTVQKRPVGTIELSNIQYTNNKDEATEFVTDNQGNLEIRNILTGKYTMEETSVSGDSDGLGYGEDGDYVIWDDDGNISNGISKTIEIKRQKSYNTTSSSKVIEDDKKVIEDGTYYIGIASSPNYTVEVDHSYAKNKANVRLYQSNQSIAQRFFIKYIGDGYYNIYSVSANKLMDVADASQEPGTNVHMWEKNGSPSQDWQIKETGDGYYYLVSKCNGLYLDLAGGIVANGTNIRVWTGNNTIAQKFKFTEISPVDDSDEHADILTVKNKRKYVKLSGYVWEDKVLGKQSTKNYLYRETSADSEDKRVANVTVNLVQNGQTIRTTTTDKDGSYLFDKVVIDDVDELYVEFEYNGMSYQSFPQEQIKLNEENGSKALEGAERKIFNNNFAEIGPNQAYNTDGKETYKLEYTRNNYESTLKFGDNPVYGYDGQRYPINNVYAQYMMSSNTYNAYNGYLDKIYTPEEIRSQKITEIKNVNLGLVEREQPDIAVAKDVESARVDIKKYSHTYKYAERFNNAGPYINGYTNEEGEQKDIYELNGNEKFSGKYGTMSYQRAIYKSDIYYDGEDKLEVHVTYKIGVRNQSTNLTSTVTNIADYYDANYTIAEIGTQINEKGEITGGQLKYTDERYSNEYSKATIQVNTVVEPQTEKYIYIDFIVKEGTLKELGENDNNTKKLQNVVEIEGYKTTDSNGNVYGGIDLDSAPGNVNPTDTSTYEDDTDRAPALELVIAQERSTSGKVFLDSTTGELKTGEERKGSGAYENGETGIQDVKVRLKEITDNNQIGETAKEYTSTGARELETTTDANGDFTLSGYIPGRYVLEYEWGDKTYKVQEYKNTIVDETAWNNKQNNEDWYKETFKKDNGEKNADGTDIRKSDALDEWSIRQNIDNQTGEDTNKLRQDIENAYNGDSSTGIITKMESRTPTYEVAIEYNEGPTTIDDEFERTGEGTILLQNNRPKQKITFKNTIENIDFGIVERPRQLLKIDKLVSNVRIRLTNSSLLVNAEIDDNGKITNDAKYVVSVMPNNRQYADPGTVKIEIDNELIQGATLEVKYKYKLENISERDYKNQSYYNFGTGGITPITLTPSLMVDYLDKDYASNGTGQWQVIQNPKRDLVERGLLANELQDNYLKNGLASVLTTNELASEKMAIGDTNDTLALEESKLLSSNDEILLDNDVEIITIEKNGGSTVETVPGNYNPVDGSTSEEDDSRAQHIIIVPPTGLPTYYIEYTILGLSCLGILVAGIVLIKKYVLKKK